MRNLLRVKARTVKTAGIGVAASVIYLAFLALGVGVGAVLLHPMYALGGVIIGWF